MNKRELAKVPRPEPIPASEKYKPSERFITTEELTIGAEQILVLNVFQQKKNSTDLVCTSRTFLAPEDYITQDLVTPKTKWREGAFHNDWDFSDKSRQFISMDDFNRFRKFLRGYESRKTWIKNPDIWNDCEEYQKAVMSIRLKKRHQVEKNAIDARMSILGNIPDEFFEWVKDDALRNSQYIFYKPIDGKRNQIRCVCSVCNESFEGDRRILGVKNHAIGECPKCASTVTYKSYGAFPQKKTDSVYVTYVDPLPEGFCLRYFLTERTFTKELGGIKQHNVEYCEVVREFIRYTDGNYANSECFQFDYFKSTQELRWCRERIHNTMYGGSTLYECYASCLYPNNLPEAWEHTPMKYSGLEILSKGIPGRPARYWDAIKRPGNYKAIEILAKEKLYNMAYSLIRPGGSGTWGAGRGIDPDGKNLGDILRLNLPGKKHQNRNNIRVLKQIDATEPQLVLMQHIDRLGTTIKPDLLVRYYNIFGVNSDLINPEMRHASLLDICRYIENVHERNKRKKLSDIGVDWQDYIGWVEELGYKMKSSAVYFPCCFYKTHDYIYKEYLAHKDAIEAEKRKQQDILVKNRLEYVEKALNKAFIKFKGNDGTNAFSYKGLVLIVPKSAQEIRDEGEALHHCVGTYINAVEQGRTSIFFVRKSDAPTVPYFTMEFKNGEVAQCRGHRNCGMPSEVRAFTKAFEKALNKVLQDESDKEKQKEAMKHAG